MITNEIDEVNAANGVDADDNFGGVDFKDVDPKLLSIRRLPKLSSPFTPYTSTISLVITGRSSKLSSISISIGKVPFLEFLVSLILTFF